MTGDQFGWAETPGSTTPECSAAGYADVASYAASAITVHDSVAAR